MQGDLGSLQASPSVPTALVDRLSAATAGSRELDFWVAYEGGILSDVLPRGCSRIEGGEREVIIYDRDGRRSGWVGYHCFDPVTQSLDAAIGLAERAMPGVWWLVGKGKVRSEEPDYGAQLLFGPDVIGEGEGPTPAIALCIAVLKARTAAEGPSVGTDERSEGVNQ